MRIDLLANTDVDLAFHEPPFTCTNEGWGEFEMSVDLFTTEKGGKSTIFHDLNFASPTYESVQTVTFKNPSQALLGILRETGPVSSEDGPAAKARKTDIAKRQQRRNTYDFEKMADGLTRLDEETLLQVIQMIHDNKSGDTYIKNDIENGEFSVDLFTMPDNLSRMLWDFLVSRCCLLGVSTTNVSCLTPKSCRFSMASYDSRARHSKRRP